MNDTARETLRLQITEAIADLKGQMDGLTENSRPVSLDDPIGRLSRMDAIANQALSCRVLADAKIRLARLERALASVDDPEFGVCLECGEEIPLPRLLAMPEASLCVHCAP